VPKANAPLEGALETVVATQKRGAARAALSHLRCRSTGMPASPTKRAR